MESYINIRINKRYFYLVIAIVIILFIVYLLKSLIFYPRYVAVYTTLGDLYLGKLSYFPKFKLSNAIILRTDPQSGQINIWNLKQTVWQSTGDLFLNRKNIIWISPVDKNSPLIDFIKQGTRLPQVPQPPTQSQPTSTSTRR